MEQIVCKKCTSLDCRGCNLLRLEQMLESGKFDALMDEKRGIKTGIDVHPVVYGIWEKQDANFVFNDVGLYAAVYKCNRCGKLNIAETNFCPNCGADMREES